MAPRVSAESDDFDMDTKISRLWPLIAWSRPESGFRVHRAAGMVDFGSAILRFGAAVASRQTPLNPGKPHSVAVQQLVTGCQKTWLYRYKVNLSRSTRVSILLLFI